MKQQNSKYMSNYVKNCVRAQIKVSTRDKKVHAAFVIAFFYVFLFLRPPYSCIRIRGCGVCTKRDVFSHRKVYYIGKHVEINST